jgi:RNA polymerase sigma factor (sigma-70 family)
MPDERFHTVLRLIRKTIGTAEIHPVPDGDLLQRFVCDRDEAAFETLLHRHARLVWHVCRSLLRETHAAEDAFQATFLILVRKAGSISRPELLGNWLYGVAQRVAQRARALQSRHHTHQGLEAVAARTVEAEADLHGRVHEELQRLPAKYRAPLVLCYLEGRTNEEAARHLQWPVGTLKVRLMRGREMLRSRLTRRGAALTAGAVTSLLTVGAASAVPSSLFLTAFRAGLAVATGRASASGAVSADAIALSEGVLRMMSATRLKLAAALLLAVSVLTVGAGLLAQSPPDGQGAPQTAAPQTAAPPRAEAPEDKPDDTASSDRLQINGVWALVTRESGGKKETPTDEEVKKGDGRLTISGGRFTLMENGGSRDGTFKINPDRSPRQIDLGLAAEPDEIPGVVLRGIYTLDKDRLTICYNNPARDFGMPRPDDFTTREASKFPTVVVYQRVSKGDQQLLQGAWTFEAANDGERIDGIVGTKMVFKGDRATATFDRGDGDFTFRLDGLSKPAKIDMVGCADGPYEGFMVLGVYALDGDTLTLCVTSNGRRPAELEPKFGVREIELKLKRLKE